MAESVTISKLESRIFDFIKSNRNGGKELVINQKTEENAMKAFNDFPKDQALTLTTNPKSVQIKGWFVNPNGGDLFECVKTTIQESEFWKYALVPNYEHFGISIKCFKSGKIFLSALLHSNSPVKPAFDDDELIDDVTPEEQPKEDKKKGKKHNKKQNKKKQNKKEEEEEIDNNEQTPEYINEKITRLFNKFLVDNGKSELHFSQRAFDIIDDYNKECCESNVQLSRPKILDSVLNFERRCVSIRQIKDPRLLDAKYIDIFFSTDYSKEQFLKPNNAIAVSFQYVKDKNYGFLVIFTGYDKDLPEPEKWDDQPLSKSTSVKHHRAEYKLNEKLNVLRHDREATIKERINKYRTEQGVGELELDKGDLHQVAYNYSSKIGKQQMMLPFKKDGLKELGLEGDALKTVCVVNTSNYVEKAFDDLVASDKKYMMTDPDWTKMAISFFENRMSHSVYVVVVFAKDAAPKAE